VLFNEPKLLKFRRNDAADGVNEVSVLFNEPKLLKFKYHLDDCPNIVGFSALQRAEIAEMMGGATDATLALAGFSALQRAEIAEILVAVVGCRKLVVFQCSSTSRNC